MGRFRVLSSFSPASQGQSKPLKGDTISGHREVLGSCDICSSQADTDPDIHGPKWKEMPAFPIGSRQQSHKSQELQRRSSIRRYLKHWGGCAGYKPAVPRCLPPSWRCGAGLGGPKHISDRAGCCIFSSTTILFHHMRNLLALPSSDPSKCPPRAKSRTWRVHLCPLSPTVGAREEPEALPTGMPWESHVLGSLGAWDTFLSHGWKRPVFVPLLLLTRKKWNSGQSIELGSWLPVRLF